MKRSVWKTGSVPCGKREAFRVQKYEGEGRYVNHQYGHSLPQRPFTESERASGFSMQYGV